jgi:hypothetical protein
MSDFGENNQEANYSREEMEEEMKLLREQLAKSSNPKVEDTEAMPVFAHPVLEEARDITYWRKNSEYRPLYEAIRGALMQLVKYQQENFPGEAEAELIRDWNKPIETLRDELEKLQAAEKSGFGLKVFSASDRATNSFSNPKVKSAFLLGKKELDREAKASKPKLPFRQGEGRHLPKASGSNYGRAKPYQKAPYHPREQRSAKGIERNECRSCGGPGHWEGDKECPNARK